MAEDGVADTMCIVWELELPLPSPPCHALGWIQPTRNPMVQIQPMEGGEFDTTGLGDILKCVTLSRQNECALQLNIEDK